MFNEVAEVLEMVDSKGAGKIVRCSDEIVRLRNCQIRYCNISATRLAGESCQNGG